MKFTSVTVALFIVAASTLNAQVGPPPNRAALQRQIIERMITNFGNQAALSDDQLARVRTAITESFAVRRRLEMRQRQLVLGLERQLRPGVAADEDSLASLVLAIHQGKQDFLDAEKAQHEIFSAFLDPVQQAQRVLMFERFQRQVQGQLRRRAGNRPGRSPG